MRGKLGVKAALWAFVFGLVPLSHAAHACEGAIGGKEGNCSPDFSLQSLDGKTVKLSSYRGKVVILNFWATWCEPCVIEIPALSRLNHEAAKSGVVMFAASIDDTKAEIEKFLQTRLKGNKPSFQVLLDLSKAVSGQYGTFKVPETYIIDKTGRIRDKIIGIHDWDESLVIHYLQLLAKE